MIAALLLAAQSAPGGTVPVAAVIDSIRCDWRDQAAARGLDAATGTLMLTLADDGAVPIEGEAIGRATQVMPFRLDAADGDAPDCRPDARLAAPALPLAGLAPGAGARGWFVLARLDDGRVTAVAADPAKTKHGVAQGFDVALEAVRTDGLRVKRANAVRRKRCVGRAGEQVCY